MANDKITDLTELTNVQNSYWFYVVDTSDTTESPEGTGKKVSKENLNLATINFLEIETYAEFLLIQNQSILVICKVLNDENKGISNTIYQLWPDGTRLWIAATEDI